MNNTNESFIDFLRADYLKKHTSPIGRVFHFKLYPIIPHPTIFLSSFLLAVRSYRHNHFKGSDKMFLFSWFVLKMIQHLKMQKR
jgi:hypothetical protein